MKKKFWFTLSVLLLMVTAAPMIYASGNGNVDIMVTQQDELTFNEIELSEVPEAVLEAAKKDFPDAQITKAKVAKVDGNKIYKLVIVKEGEEKSIALYNSDGTTYTPNS